MVKFYLDGVEVVNPRGWEDIKTTIKREPDTDGVLIYCDNELEFTGDGYQYLWNKAKTEGFCYRVSVDATKTYQGATKRVFSGYIYISDVQFNERTRVAKVKAEDNTFYSKINNNKSLKAVLTAGKSKNNVDITPCTKFSLQVYALDNTTLIKTPFAIRVDDAFRYLVEFMTDGEVGFVSDTFAYGGTWGDYVITDGLHLSTPTTAVYSVAPIVSFSFKELYDEIKKRFPIGFSIENPYTTPKLRIEAMSYYNSTANSTVVMADINQINTRFDQSKLYSAVNLGSTTTIDGTAYLDFPEDIDFFGFKDESFNILGTCNIDNVLNLVGDWVVSSNIIQDCTVNNNQDNDDKLFLIDTIQESEFVGRTRNTDFLDLAAGSVSGLVYFYNERLNNRNVAERYLGLLPNSLAQYFAPSGTGNNPTFTVVADAVSENIGAHYNAATGEYTAYTGGVFDFTLNCVDDKGSVFHGYVRIMIYDSTGNLKRRGTAFTCNTGTRQARYVMTEGDVAKLVYYAGNTSGSSITTTLFKGSWWSCIANTGTGGIFQDYDPANYAINIHEFQYPLSETQVDTLLANPTELIRFYSDADFQRYAWINELTINNFTGLASVKLITSQSNGN
jgi:hypothetical protein